MRPRDRAAAAGRLSRTTRAILAWDIGVVVFLALSAFLFTTERLERMPADAAAQEEGEWTIFWLTSPRSRSASSRSSASSPASRTCRRRSASLHVSLVAVTLFVSWLMTHITFAFRYAHEFYEVR